MKNFKLISLVSLVIAIAALFFPLGGSKVLGGMIHNVKEYFSYGLVDGGKVFNYTADAATVSAREFCDGKLLVHTPTATTTTLTLPTSASIIKTCLQNKGDSIKLLVKNGAAATYGTTITAGTGIILVGETSSDDALAAGEQATIEAVNYDGSSVIVVADDKVDED